MSHYIRWLEVGEPGYYRILEYIQCLKKVVKWGDRILELGAYMPVISDYFRQYYGCETIYAGIENETPETAHLFRKINMCTDDFGEGWDIVTATEVMEHLPCNLYRVRDKLIAAVRPSGYLLVTAPVAGIGRGDTKLEDEIEGDWDKGFEHIKEFRNVEEFKSLFEGRSLEIVDEWFSESRVVGEGSYLYNTLYRKN